MHPNRIKKLSPLLINQLAAGEVVTRPASVVKELLENAIDAGADVIDVCITQGGMGMIEVADNGQGILPEDMSMAVTRHATSKVADVANLHGIATLGFRGEALASIVAVSRVCLVSSADDSGIGRKLTVTGVIGDTPDIVPCVCQRGTQVTVKDLYFNVPARRGNLKNIATEYQHIETVVKDIATAHPDIALHLYHEGKCRLKLPSVTLTNNQYYTDHQNTDHLSQITDNHQQDRVFAPYLSRLQQVLDLSGVGLLPFYRTLSPYLPSMSGNADELFYVAGWLWQSATSKRERLIYVNHRLVKLPAISQQIRQTLTAQGVDAEAVSHAIYLLLPSQLCNLNVHPSKQTIHIQALSTINSHLHDCLSKLDKTQLHQKLTDTSPSWQKPKTIFDTLPQSAISVSQQRISQSVQSGYPKSFQEPSQELSQKPSNNAQVNSPQAIYQVSHASDVSAKSTPLTNDDNPILLSHVHRLSPSLCGQILTNRAWQFVDNLYQIQTNNLLSLTHANTVQLPTTDKPWSLSWHRQTLVLTVDYCGKPCCIAKLSADMILHHLLTCS